MAYVVINNKSNSHMNIILNSNKRVFTNASVLYRVLSNNFDVVENITKRVVKMQNNDVIKSIQTIGREHNKLLRKTAFHVFDAIGWDQHQFNIGFDYIKETFYDRISDDLKTMYVDVIEEAFFTMPDRNSFYQFLRDYTEGSIKSKENIVELLKDIMYGIKFNDMMNEYYNNTYGINEE